MSTPKQSGHAKNVANFASLITACTGYGVKYNPSDTSLRIAVLSHLYADAAMVMDKLKDAERVYKEVTNTREETFAPLLVLTSRVVNALSSTKVSRLTVDDVVALQLKIQGKRAGKKPEPKKSEDGETMDSPKTISAAQMSFDYRVENFTKLVKVLAAQPLYKPNEEDLKVTALLAVLADMNNRNEAVRSATNIYSNARIERDTVLYGNETGLFDVANSVKKYVKSVFRQESQPFKQISGLVFKRITRIKNIPAKPIEIG